MSRVPIVVLGGRAYADIDVLACALAYKQYLQLLGHPSNAVLTGPWNQTIPPLMRRWQIEVEKTFPYPDQPCNFVLVDLSDPHHVDPFVDLDRVIEVFDHHYGHESYWESKIGKKARIEKVGACATLIWECIAAQNLQKKIAPVHIDLLYTAIFANTLDFQSAVTHERDRQAAKELLSYSTLPSDWKASYYNAIEHQFLHDPLPHILEDTKQISLLGSSCQFGQIELYDAAPFIKKYQQDLNNLEQHRKGPWIVNIVSIKERCSYLFCNSADLSSKIAEITSGSKENPFIRTPRLWLRKEYLREFMKI